MGSIQLNKKPLNVVMLNTAYLNEGNATLKDKSKKYIKFEDPEVLRVLLAKGVDKDGDGGITEEEAAAVTSIGTWFRSNTIIETFDEFEKFTNASLSSNTGNSSSSFFECTSLRSISLPNKAMSVSSTFSGCSSLEYVKNMEYLETIGSYSFYNTYLLKMEINLPNLKGIINNAAFYNSGITKIHSLGNITKINGSGRASACFGNCTNLGFVSLPESLVTLGDDAFYNCTSLFVNNFNLPNLTTLGAESFYNCTSLAIEDLSLPNLETLGKDAFYGVKIKKISSLGKITSLPTANNSTQNFGDKSVLEEIVLPESLTEFPEQCFYGYVALKKCNIPSNVSHIPWNCFNGCSNLGVNLSFEDTISFNDNAFYRTGIISLYAPFATSFKNSVFSSCSSLRSVIVGGTTIGERVFYLCKSLECVELGNNVTSIGWYSFNGCVSLKYIKISTITPPSLGSSVFNNTNNCPIYVPDASVTAYREASGWLTYADRIKPLSEYTE